MLNRLKKISSKLIGNFQRIFTLMMIYIISSSSVILPRYIAISTDLSKIKGKIKFFVVNSYILASDSVGILRPLLNSKSYISYHKAGNTIVTEIYGVNNRLTEHICQYDTKGRLVEMRTWESVYQTISPSERFTYKYDNHNRLTESLTFTEDDSIATLEESFHYYSEKNQVIKYVIQRKPQKDVSYKKIYCDTLFYDDWNKEVTVNPYRYTKIGKSLQRMDFGKNALWVDLYNNKKERVETSSYDSLNSLREKSTYTYDEHGNLRTAIVYKNDSLSYTNKHQYTYDNIGNWTNDSIFRNDKLIQILVRRFEYY